ncbi:heterokaryon incompatibility protein [Apiospora rasikravindrae]|uniref:Heterokaryon incompatibility protein n=1 Tax=Apiospora rasikravindrae TaxID=990691 RepID=A0ABR1SWE2_9PEZI
MDANTIRYAALSHCWGPQGVDFKLLSRNVDAFRLQIHWDILSLTFQEAILAATRLGIQYIWIDALCIVQDSAEDWKIEASRMMQVYTNCYINISADASTDGTGGLFRQRDPARFQPFLVTPGGNGSNAPFYCYSNNWGKYVERAPLIKRSWVTQERFMSPRIVHFSNDQSVGCPERRSGADFTSTPTIPEGSEYCMAYGMTW